MTGLTLYGGDLLETIRPRSIVYVVESLTEVGAGQSAGLPVVCAPLSEGGGWQPGFTEQLRGFDVICVRSSGYPHSYGPVKWRGIARDITKRAARVRMLDLPAVDGDTVDDLASYLQRHSAAEFAELAEAMSAELPRATATSSDDGRGSRSTEDDDLAEATARWPDPMAPEAFYGLAGAVVRTIEPTTEADPVALLLNFLGYFGSCAGLNPRFQVEDTDHGLNEFIGIVGATSKSRKGTADKRVRRLFQLTDSDWTERRVRSGLSSGEGLIWAVRDQMMSTDPKTGEKRVEDEGESDKRLLIVESEMATVLRRIEREGSSLSALMRNAWDRVHPLEALVSERSRAQARAVKHHISVIGHITKAELARYLTRTEAANGLGNRFIWICVRRARLLPHGAASPNLNEVVSRVNLVLEFLKSLEAPVGFDAGAAKAWVAVYELLSEGKPGLLGAMIARGEAHVVRLATTYAVLDLSPEIRLPHLLAALAVWDFSEASARYIFGEELGDTDADEVLRAVRESPDGLTTNQLRDHFSGHWDSKRTGRALSSLSDQGIVEVGKESTAGRPAKRYRVTPAAATVRGESYLARAKAVGGGAVSAVSALSADSNTKQGETFPPEACAVSPGSQRPTGLTPQLPRTYGASPHVNSVVETGDTALPALSALTALAPHDEGADGASTPGPPAPATVPAEPAADQDHPADLVPTSVLASDPVAAGRLDLGPTPDSAFEDGPV
jgi:hypothetical protein